MPFVPSWSGSTPRLGSPKAIVTVAKGFDSGNNGNAIHTLPVTIAEFTDAPVVAVGGPSKANEVAFGLPTAVVFGSGAHEALLLAHDAFRTPNYRVTATTDVIGLEIAAAMKNAYAIALGVADGLEKRKRMRPIITFARRSFLSRSPRWGGGFRHGWQSGNRPRSGSARATFW